MEIFKKYITAKNIIFFVIMLLILFFLTKIKDVVILFFASYVIACSLNPLVDKLETKGVKRSLASSLVLFGGLSIIGLFMIPIFMMGGHQVKSFLTVLPARFETAKAFMMSVPILNQANLTHLNLSDIIASASGLTSNVVTSSITLSKEVMTALIYSLAACIIIYYFMADRDVVREAYLKLFPKSMKNKADEIAESVSNKIGGYVVALVVTMLSVGIIMLIGLLILGIDYPFILGLITAVFDIVPIVGPALALVVILISVAKAGLLKIALVIGLFAFAQWAENNLVRPYVFSKFLNLHPLIIYFFLFVTAQYLGIIGVVFAPAIAATACVIFEELYIKTINQV